MSDKPPIWLMDVDGVLNVLHVQMPDGYRSFKSSNGYLMTFREELLERLANLHRSGRVEIQWLTTWANLADELLADEFGLPRGLAVAGSPPLRDKSAWWKLDVVKDVVDTGARVIWTDDDIVWIDAATDWLLDQDDDQIIWQAPDAAQGITDEFVDLVEKWI